MGGILAVEAPGEVPWWWAVGSVVLGLAGEAPGVPRGQTVEASEAASDMGFRPGSDMAELSEVEYTVNNVDNSKGFINIQLKYVMWNFTRAKKKQPFFTFILKPNCFACISTSY